MVLNKAKPGPITPTAVKRARADAGLTQAQAAEVVHVSVRTWQKWEQGEAGMSLALFELFLLKTGLGDWFKYLGTVNID